MPATSQPPYLQSACLTRSHGQAKSWGDQGPRQEPPSSIGAMGSGAASTAPHDQLCSTARCHYSDRAPNWATVESVGGSFLDVALSHGWMQKTAGSRKFNNFSFNFVQLQPALFRTFRFNICFFFLAARIDLPPETSRRFTHRQGRSGPHELHCPRTSIARQRTSTSHARFCRSCSSRLPAQLPRLPQLAMIVAMRAVRAMSLPSKLGRRCASNG